MKQFAEAAAESVDSEIERESRSHINARKNLLANALRTTKKWIGSRVDPDLGNVGKNFLAAFKETGCKQEIEIKHKGSVAVYNSFHLRKGFMNHIVYGPDGEEHLGKLYSSRVHESIHAIQKMLSAGLHASPFNSGTTIILCPRDWIMLEERCEQDAYVKQALFNNLLARDLPEMAEMTRRDGLSVEEFTAFRASSASPLSALQYAAEQALEKSFKAPPNDTYLFRHHYHDTALSNYEMAIRQRDKEDLVFVRAEPEDILAIGQSIGIPLFGSGTLLPAFATPPVLMENADKRLKKLDASLNIADENMLPALGEALAKLGLTRESFIDKSYGKNMKTNPGIPVPAPGQP